MATDSEQEHKVPMGITIGGVIAKAALVAGAVALGVAVIASFGGFSQGTGPSTVPGFISQAIDWVKQGTFTLSNIDIGRTAAFAAAVGGGGYLLGSFLDGKKEQVAERQDERDSLTLQQGGYAAVEQTKAIQGLMKARLMMTNPEYFAQAGAGRNV